MPEHLSIESKIKKCIANGVSVSNSQQFAYDTENIYEQLSEDHVIELIPSPYYDSEEEQLPSFSFLTAESLSAYQNSSSIKFSNILLNIEKLVSKIPEITMMAFVIAKEIPVLKVCAVLSICNHLFQSMRIELTKDDYFLIVALWKNCDKDNHISFDHGFNSVNTLLKYHGEQPLSRKKFDCLLKNLESIRCIDTNLKNQDIVLRERILGHISD